MRTNESTRKPGRKQKATLSLRCLILTSVVLLGTIFILSMSIYLKNYAVNEAEMNAIIFGIESEPIVSESTIEEPITSLMDTLESEYNVLENRDVELDALPIGSLPKGSLPKESLPKESLPKVSLPKVSLPKESLPKELLPVNTSRFAYAFLVAGCKPEDPTYKGYIYNIAIAKDILKTQGSTADVVVMIRLHIDTKATKLLPEDEAILTKSGIIVKYIPRPLSDTFHTAMMDKFRILEMTEYERVIYLDADVIPLNNLDYMFENSVGPNAKLQENVVLSFHQEPSSGGFFMLKPDEEDFLEITKIIERRESEGYHFNETIGWGHVITPPDYWESFTNKNQTTWSFYGAFTDQGLLYYWTKYVKKNVTVINGKKMTAWIENESGEVQIIREDLTLDILSDAAKKPGLVTPMHRKREVERIPPYRDYHHFVENDKPWWHKETALHVLPHIKKPNTPLKLWFNILHKVEAEYNFGINTTSVWTGRPTLGKYPTNSMVMWAKESREKANASQ